MEEGKEPRTEVSSLPHITLTGLDDGHQYRLKVKDINADGENSNFSEELET